MDWALSVLVVISGVLWGLWRSSAKHARQVEEKARIVEAVSHGTLVAAQQVQRSLEQREDELAKVDEAHKILRAELVETAKAIQATRLEDGTLEKAWNDYTGGE